jgi:transglutaminase-like putative cysteine protease
MPSRYPARPFNVPLTTTACERLAILEELLGEAWRGSAAVARLGRALQQGRRAPRRELAARALRLVQALPYVPDPAGEEWFQPVDWTLRHGGDCEDLASALVAVAGAAGVPARLVWIDQPGQKLNHVSAQLWVLERDPVEDGDPRPHDGWAWAEASVRGAALAEDPYRAAKRTGQLANLGVAA